MQGKTPSQQRHLTEDPSLAFGTDLGNIGADLDIPLGRYGLRIYILDAAAAYLRAVSPQLPEQQILTAGLDFAELA